MRGMIAPSVSFVTTLLAAAVTLPGVAARRHGLPRIRRGDAPRAGAGGQYGQRRRRRRRDGEGHGAAARVPDGATAAPWTARAWGRAPPPSPTASRGSATARRSAPRRRTTPRPSRERPTCSCCRCLDGLQFVRRARAGGIKTPGDHTLTIKALVFQAARRRDDEVGRPPRGLRRVCRRGARRLRANSRTPIRCLRSTVATRKVTATWPATCGAEGPRGLAIDEAHEWLFVACTNGARVLDLAHDGKVVGRVDVGAGVDNLAYDVARRRLFVAAARAETWSSRTSPTAAGVAFARDRRHRAGRAQPDRRHARRGIRRGYGGRPAARRAGADHQVALTYRFVKTLTSLELTALRLNVEPVPVPVTR